MQYRVSKHIIQLSNTAVVAKYGIYIEQKESLKTKKLPSHLGLLAQGFVQICAHLFF